MKYDEEEEKRKERKRETRQEGVKKWQASTDSDTCTCGRNLCNSYTTRGPGSTNCNRKYHSVILVLALASRRRSRTIQIVRSLGPYLKLNSYMP